MLIDTCVAIWILQDSPKLSQRARSAIASEHSAGRALSISAISIAEIIYLVERNRVESELLTRLLDMVRDERSGLHSIALDASIAAATSLVDRSAVPDFPDRLIAATSLVIQEPLITADGKIRRAMKNCIW